MTALLWQCLQLLQRIVPNKNHAGLFCCKHLNGQNWVPASIGCFYSCAHEVNLHVSRYDFDLPQEQYISEEKQEEVRNWVITVSMDQQVDQSLSTRCCDQCGSDIYEASLICKSCKVPCYLQNSRCAMFGPQRTYNPNSVWPRVPAQALTWFAILSHFLLYLWD